MLNDIKNSLIGHGLRKTMISHVTGETHRNLDPSIQHIKSARRIDGNAQVDFTPLVSVEFGDKGVDILDFTLA